MVMYQAQYCLQIPYPESDIPNMKSVSIKKLPSNTFFIQRMNKSQKIDASFKDMHSFDECVDVIIRSLFTLLLADHIHNSQDNMNIITELTKHVRLHIGKHLEENSKNVLFTISKEDLGISFDGDFSFSASLIKITDNINMLSELPKDSVAVEINLNLYRNTKVVMTTPEEYFKHTGLIIIKREGERFEDPTTYVAVKKGASIIDYCSNYGSRFYVGQWVAHDLYRDISFMLLDAIAADPLLEDSAMSDIHDQILGMLVSIYRSSDGFLECENKLSDDVFNNIYGISFPYGFNRHACEIILRFHRPGSFDVQSAQTDEDHIKALARECIEAARKDETSLYSMDIFNAAVKYLSRNLTVKIEIIAEIAIQVAELTRELEAETEEKINELINVVMDLAEITGNGHLAPSELMITGLLRLGMVQTRPDAMRWVHNHDTLSNRIAIMLRNASETRKRVEKGP